MYILPPLTKNTINKNPECSSIQTNCRLTKNPPIVKGGIQGGEDS